MPDDTFSDDHAVLAGLVARVSALEQRFADARLLVRENIAAQTCIAALQTLPKDSQSKVITWLTRRLGLAPNAPQDEKQQPRPR